MSHELYTLDNGKKSIGYAANTAMPWHGLGQQIPEDASLDIWSEMAGLDWEIQSQPALMQVGNNVIEYPARMILSRSDNGYPLAIVSDRYKVVQPADILDFYRTLIESSGFKMDTAGSLFKGKKIWALARTGDDFEIAGDRVESYLLLATACDGTLATTAQFTSVRVVCNNTLSFAVNHSDTGAEYAIKVPHHTEFDGDAVKRELAVVHDNFGMLRDQVHVLSERQVSSKETLDFFIGLLGDPSKSLEDQPQARRLSKVLDLYNGQGKGSNLVTAKGTAWGLVNAVTQYADHDRPARSTDARIDSAWFGGMHNLKLKAFNMALELAMPAPVESLSGEEALSEF